MFIMEYLVYLWLLRNNWLSSFSWSSDVLWGNIYKLAQPWALYESQPRLCTRVTVLQEDQSFLKKVLQSHTCTSENTPSKVKFVQHITLVVMIEYLTFSILFLLL